VQPLLRAVEEAPTLMGLRVAVWPLARVVALLVVAAVLEDRVRRPTAWPPCPVCGTRLERKGFVERQGDFAKKRYQITLVQLGES